MRNYVKVLVVVPFIAIFASACNFSTNNVTPTAEGTVQEPINPLPQNTLPASPTPSLTPSPTSQPLEIITPTPRPTDEPTAIPVPTETPGPWEYVVQPGDNLGFIIQKSPHNYPGYDQAVINLIVAMNDNITSADVLPPPGSTILIPRPTQIPVVVGVDESGNSITSDESPSTRQRVGVTGPVGCHTVREGETAVGIVEQYGGMTLEILSQLNADINFFGCNFEEPSGGESCSPIIVAGQCVNVLLPTATPTLSPTPSGSETPTLTPTFRAPYLISPPEGGRISGSLVTLYWDSVGVLKPGQYYLIQVTNTTSGTSWAEITQETDINIPASIKPPAGETQTINWNVSVAQQDNSGAYAPVGDPGTIHSFSWQG